MTSPSSHPVTQGQGLEGRAWRDWWVGPDIPFCTSSVIHLVHAANSGQGLGGHSLGGTQRLGEFPATPSQDAGTPGYRGAAQPCNLGVQHRAAGSSGA